jgi:hypothetical protein
VPELVVQIGATACLGLVTYHGIGSMWHISAILGIGSGVWVDEEWVELMDRPWMATSLSELWGKRYHQVSHEGREGRERARGGGVGSKVLTVSSV